MINAHYCALCSVLLTTDNNSKEHIIPKSIGGGTATTQWFICKRCNNQTGTTWDAKLDRQLSGWLVLLHIPRGKGGVRNHDFLTGDGGTVRMLSTGELTRRPTVRRISDKKVVAQASRHKEARQILRQEVSQEELANATVTETMEETPFPSVKGLPFFTGGHDVGRSLVKMTLALAHSSDIQPGMCELAIRYLTDNDSDACWQYHLAPSLVEHAMAGTPIHCVGIDADAESRHIRGYVEILGIVRVSVLLSQSYRGICIRKSIAVNPLTGQPCEHSVKWGQWSYSPNSDIVDEYVRYYELEVLPLFRELNKDEEIAFITRRLHSAKMQALQRMSRGEGQNLTQNEYKVVKEAVRREVCELLAIHEEAMQKGTEFAQSLYEKRERDAHIVLNTIWGWPST